MKFHKCFAFYVFYNFHSQKLHQKKDKILHLGFKYLSRLIIIKINTLCVCAWSSRCVCYNTKTLTRGKIYKFCGTSKIYIKYILFKMCVYLYVIKIRGK